MKISNSNINDIDEIFRLYETAINFQKEKGAVQWGGLTRELVEMEIAESRQ